jgi:hypothetical protein
LHACISSDGTVIDAAQLVEQVGPVPAGMSTVDYLVKTLGFAWLEAFRSGYRVCVQPGLIAPKTEAALYFILNDRRIRRVLVSLVLETSCQDWVFASGAQAVDGIAGAVAAEREKRAPRFACQPFGELQGFPPLQRLYEFFRASGGAIDPVRLQAIASDVLKDRFVMVERGDDAVLRICAVGSGYRALDTRWSSRSGGSRIEDQPDLDYGAWIGRGYRAALETMDVRIETVDAIIYRPRVGRGRYGYRRLMLPFCDLDGRQHLLSASVADPSVDLGIGRASDAS